MTKTLAALTAALVFGLGPGRVALGAADPPKTPAYKTVHVFTPGSVHDEKLLFALLQEFNAVVARLGAPGVRYRLWKAVGTDGDKAELMYESSWPSRDVYDRIHKEKEYRALLEKYLPFLRQVLKNEAYTGWLAAEMGTPAKDKKGKR